MRLVTILFLLSWFVALPATSSPNPDNPEVAKIEVTPNQQVAPGTIEVKINVTPHQDNIGFCVGYKIEDMPPEIEESRRSCQQLNGIYSPRVLYFSYKNIPAENYRAFVEIYRAPNRLAGKAQAKFVIVSS